MEFHIMRHQSAFEMVTEGNANKRLHNFLLTLSSSILVTGINFTSSYAINFRFDILKISGCRKPKKSPTEMKQNNRYGTILFCMYQQSGLSMQMSSFGYFSFMAMP
uniref:Uncharacterized protein n=1 Tax=Glossina brevipalpis TaxID=37001 RepID=A0A1A9WVC5_9MUSC